MEAEGLTFGLNAIVSILLVMKNKNIFKIKYKKSPLEYNN